MRFNNKPIIDAADRKVEKETKNPPRPPPCFYRNFPPSFNQRNWMNIPSPLLTVPLQFLFSRYLKFSRTELSGRGERDDIPYDTRTRMEFVEFARFGRRGDERSVERGIRRKFHSFKQIKLDPPGIPSIVVKLDYIASLAAQDIIIRWLDVSLKFARFDVDRGAGTGGGGFRRAKPLFPPPNFVSAGYRWQVGRRAAIP